MIFASNNSDSQSSKEIGKFMGNIILNHDFSDGMHSWRPNSCDAFVIPAGSGYCNGSTMAVVTNRKIWWQGLEQDITRRISAGSSYTVSACIGASGTFQGSVKMVAKIKLVYRNSETRFLSIGKKYVSKESWGMLEGSFSLSAVPNEVIFYVEGPPPEADLLIKSVEFKEKMEKAPVITANNYFDSQSSKENGKDAGNIIFNHDFSYGLYLWHPNCCDAFVVPAGYHKGLAAAIVTNRKECWHGLEQDITSRVSEGSTYTVAACVGVSGAFQRSVEVLATLKLEYQYSETRFLFIAKKSASKECCVILEGSFSLSTMPDQVIFYLEGPPAGTDLLIKSVVISCPSSTACDSSGTSSVCSDDDNIIINPQFDDGLNNWSGRGCKVALHDSMADGKITPMSGKAFASATERTQSWNGIQQDVTGRVKRKLAYEVTAVVRIYGNNVTSADLRSTLYVKAADNRERYIGIASVQATDNLGDVAREVSSKLLTVSGCCVFLKGPRPGTDILLNSFVIKHSSKAPSLSPPSIEDADFGVNIIITNTILTDGTNGWFPHGSCTMSVQTGSPLIIPPLAIDSLGAH